MRLAANVFTNCHDGIFVTDANHIIVDVNPACSRISGFSRDETIGQPATMFCAQPNKEEFLSSVREGSSEGRPLAR